ncbi:MAG: hypothetical protein ABH956_00015 [Candidatus Nealsonbacteria bacterium]
MSQTMSCARCQTEILKSKAQKFRGRELCSSCYNYQKKHWEKAERKVKSRHGRTYECISCNGTSRILGEKCQSCNGRGYQDYDGSDHIQDFLPGNWEYSS